MDISKTYIISPYFNPIKYQSRRILQQSFVKYIQKLGLKIIVPEIQHPKSPFDFNSLKFVSKSILWHKERLVNLTVQRLPKDWEYIAWIDGDVKFLNDNWIEEMHSKLELHPIIQLFQYAVDLNQENNLLKTHNGYAYSYNLGQIQSCDTSKFHSGFAWACTREWFEAVGGLIDYSILGSADRQMADAFIGKTNYNFISKISKEYADKIIEYQNKNAQFGGNLGYIDGTLTHYYHGDKRNRFYGTRNKILMNHKFNPDTDLEQEWNGLFKIKKPQLQKDISLYFLSRNEDSKLEGFSSNYNYS